MDSSSSAKTTFPKCNRQIPPSLTNRLCCNSPAMGVHLLAGSLLGVNGSLLTHGSQDNNVWGRLSVFSVYGMRCVERLTGILLLNLEELGDTVTNLTLGKLDVVLGDTIVGHQGEEAIVGDINLRAKSVTS